MVVSLASEIIETYQDNNLLERVLEKVYFALVEDEIIVDHIWLIDLMGKAFEYDPNKRKRIFRCIPIGYYAALLKTAKEANLTNLRAWLEDVYICAGSIQHDA